MAKPVGPYTPVVRAGDFLFVSGQIGLDGEQLVEGMAAQARQALLNVKTLLEAHGSSLDKVVKTTVYLTDVATYSTMNDIYMEAFGDHRPARAAVAVAALPKGAEFEIEAIAHDG